MTDPRPPDEPEDDESEFDRFEALTKKLLEAKPRGSVVYERLPDLIARLDTADTPEEKRRIGEELAQLAELPERGEWELPDDE